MTTVRMLDAPCDRCGKVTHALDPWWKSETITFRSKVIEKPWLCLKCFKAEKKKWWAARE